MTNSEVIKKAWLKLVNENSDVFGELTSDLLNTKIETCSELVHDKNSNPAFAMARLRFNGKIKEISVEISEIVLDLEQKEALEVILHEMAHAAVGYEYGTLFYDENKGHNSEWHWYVDALNKKGFDITETGEKYFESLYTDEELASEYDDEF